MIKKILCPYVEDEKTAEEILNSCGFDTSLKMYFANPNTTIWYDIRTSLPIARFRKNVLEVKEYDGEE